MSVFEFKDTAGHDRWDEVLFTAETLSQRYGGKPTARTIKNWRAGDTNSGPRFFRVGQRVMYRLSDVLDWESRFVRESGPAQQSI